VQTALEARFAFMAGKASSPRARRVFTEAPAEALRDVLEFAVRELGFDHLCAITGTDERTALAAQYCFARADGTVLAVRVRVPREAPVLESVTSRFPCAANYERELVDLLGFEVRDLPPGKRYPLPDDWPLDQKPLRKDWKFTPPAPKAAT
jgi:membrane-bound hydrogenase subunit beta